MKIFIYPFLILSFSSIQLIAQTLTPEYLNYDWEGKPAIHSLNAEELKTSAVGFKYKIMREYIYDKAGELELYVTKHQVVHVINDDAIEQFNKVYVPFRLNEKIISIKARTITPDGKIKEVNQSNIKELQNDDDQSSYKIFALEGVEKGSDVEYLYTTKINPNIYGVEYLQDEYPKKNIELDIISPTNLGFKTKSYNGLSAAVADSSLTDKNFLKIKSDSMPMLYDEDFAVYSANLQRVEYKLAYNYAKNNVEIYDWAKAADIYWQAYNVSDEKLIAEINKFLKKQILTTGTDRDKIIALDNYLKNNFNIQDAEVEDLTDIKKILTNKVANEEGMLKLYTGILNALEIPYELVITTDRKYSKFDGDFQSWSFLDHFLLYASSIDLWLTPADATIRNGFIPEMWSENDGLFIKKISVGAVTSGIGKVKHIPAMPSIMSQHNTYATVNFDGNFDEIKLHLVEEMSGYAAGFQAYYSFFTEDKKKEIQVAYLKSIGEDAVLSNIKVENHLLDTNQYHPIIFEADVVINSLIEHAGNKYLFKIGNLLGPQSQLYNEKPRVNAVENDYNRMYNRTLTFNIPDGYTISNLDDLKLDFELTDNGKSETYFRSTYTVNANTVVVSIIENYNQIHYSIEKYEEYKKVINAAADFNKVVLVIEKSN